MRERTRRRILLQRILKDKMQSAEVFDKAVYLQRNIADKIQTIEIRNEGAYLLYVTELRY